MKKRTKGMIRLSENEVMDILSALEGNESGYINQRLINKLEKMYSNIRKHRLEEEREANIWNKAHDHPEVQKALKKWKKLLLRKDVSTEVQDRARDDFFEIKEKIAKEMRNSPKR